MQVHDFCEEVYILDGAIIDLRLDQTFTAGYRSAATRPWHSPDGCLTCEVRYRA